ncbi:MAG: hypothetical protein LBE59_11150, partial [Nevskiaceae bacterium]|nr:hypothetical protein [Nevskiaceae bacterium]
MKSHLLAGTTLLTLMSAAGAVALAAQWQPSKTPWGDPDLQGTWPISHLMSTPLQRPAEFGERLEFTSEELEAQHTRITAQNDRFKAEEAEGRIAMGHWMEETEAPVQTSLIVDPVNGQLPALTDLGKQLSKTMGSDWNREYFDSIADFGTWNRCITRGLPNGMLPNPYNNGIQLIQAPGYVVINMEMVHETRIVPLDGRPALDGEIKQWLGSSRGHWEGNTLVVETSNFNGQTSQTDVPTRGSPRDPTPASTEMKIVERFERTGPETMTYTVTITDPVMQATPWTVRAPWKLDNGYHLFEYA